MKLTCNFCGLGTANIALLDDPVNLRVCRSCRDSILSGFAACGVVMSAKNPILSDLCVDSHALKSVWYQYYDSVNQRMGVVIQKK